MIKHARLYRLPVDWAIDLAAIDAALARMPFQPCGPTQQESTGWAPPRGEAHAALVESVAGQRIARFVIERKAVPGPVVKRRLDERLAEIEAKEGRKPGRKEQRELKDQVVRELLPAAFPKTTAVLVWFDPGNGRLVLDCASRASADLVITALVRALPGLRVVPLDTQVSPLAAMTQWLTGTAEAWPARLAPGREVELKSGDEMNSVIKFTRHHLDDEEMRRHIKQGKLPTKLALDWDGRVSFVLTEAGDLRKLAFLEGVFAADHEGGFDADIAISTGELSALITDLTAALGGEQP